MVRQTGGSGRGLVFAGFLIGFWGCGAPPGDEIELQSGAISGGQVEGGYPAVGCLTGATQCTGTLIAPNLVLAAKHCGAGMTTFWLGSTCGAPSISHTVDHTIFLAPTESKIPWTTPPHYPNDLAVYHLQTPIYDVRPLQVSPLGYPAIGTKCVAVGFGLDSAGNLGVKRSATVKVEETGEVGYVYGGLGYTIFRSAIRVSPGPAGSLPPSGGTEGGDSGSPLFCNGSGVVQGVLAGHLDWPLSGRYYTAVDGSQPWNAAWVTRVASNYVNEPMISVTSWGTSRFDMFIRGTDGAIYAKTWNNGTWSPSQFGWNYLGGFIIGTPEAVSWGNNRIDLFMRGGDPNPQTETFNAMVLWHLFWNGSSWNWEKIGGAGIASHPVAVSWGVNRLDVFALGSNGFIYHYYTSNGTNWGVEAVPTDGGPTTFLAPMKAFSTTAGSLDLYAIGTDNVPYHNHYDSNGVWSGWHNLGGQVMGTPAVTTWGGGRQDIFFEGTDTNLYHKAFFGGNSWVPSQQGWANLGGPIDGSPAAASMRSDWLTLVSNTPSGQLANKGWFNGSQWFPTNTTWTPMGGIANGAPVLVGIPNIGANLFTVGASFTPGLSSRTLTTNFGGIGSLGGIASW